MSDNLAAILARSNNDPTRLVDILNEIQAAEGCISEAAIDWIGRATGLSRVNIEQTLSFYHFFSRTQRGKYTVYLNNSAVSEMMGCSAVAAAFEEAAGCLFGSVTPDGLIGLFYTADIGMNDQEVAAIINDVVFTCLTPEKARQLVRAMQQGIAVQDLVTEYGDGNNCSERVCSMVRNNIQKTGPVYFGAYQQGAAIKKCVTMSPQDVISEMKKAYLRGRGGAGFPTGMKWELCTKAKDPRRCVIANADEGEPGTFKDRVLMTELPHLLFEGMAVCGYAIGATTGIVYLRAEYRYLKAHLEHILAQMRLANLLGNSIGGKTGFDFDIRIQLGAGAYVCGEESALIESAEGKRGEPRDRPPFPVEKGYLAIPTVVDNVETFSTVVQIIDKGAEWFSSMGTRDSKGTKLLSISGDCDHPGVYEVPFGTTIGELLTMAGARDPLAVQVGGPSGSCISAAQRDVIIAFEGCSTAGSIIIIGSQRDLLAIMYNFMEFFTDESCGSCAPCRMGTVLMRNTLKRIINRQGTAEDLTTLRELGAVMKKANKCGLGQTAPNPVLTSMANFPEIYNALLPEESDILPRFDLATAVQASCAYVGRTPNLSPEHVL
ncbi:NADH-ubiquinone oxidoreductase-F iron-sulfur binding region domain-containing protein [Candidatus Electronema sp. PJ]|uniref:NADH-ubiquinone oxidoreductase-F iron-sulfur binding region domain-containing protein n=1 Tax=Candidatus Electronema sp. PJ TaxID=3401572 RepID=UPI003AA91028